MSGSSKKLYVYELVLSKAEYKKLAGRKILSSAEWQQFCESMSDALDLAASAVIEGHDKTSK